MTDGLRPAREISRCSGRKVRGKRLPMLRSKSEFFEGWEAAWPGLSAASICKAPATRAFLAAGFADQTRLLLAENKRGDRRGGPTAVQALCRSGTIPAHRRLERRKTVVRSARPLQLPSRGPASPRPLAIQTLQLASASARLRDRSWSAVR